MRFKKRFAKINPPNGSQLLKMYRNTMNIFLLVYLYYIIYDSHLLISGATGLRKGA